MTRVVVFSMVHNHSNRGREPIGSITSTKEQSFLCQHSSNACVTALMMWYTLPRRLFLMRDDV